MNNTVGNQTGSAQLSGGRTDSGNDLRSESAPLLTIAIPTFNRAPYLERCLAQIVKQTAAFEDKVELIVSDNCSTDQTEEVVNRYIAGGSRINFLKNHQNLGPDGNFRKCFEAARGTYFLLFSDDDLLLDGALGRILSVIESSEYGVVYLRTYFFVSDHERERPNRKTTGPVIFDDLARFIDKVDVWFTFISGNVINKSLVYPELNLADFEQTNLLQLSWTFSSLFNSRRNVYYDDYLVAGQGDNTGGYKFCEVFGSKMYSVFRIFIEKFGVDRKYFDIITRKSLKKHLSKYILSSRKGFGSYHEEDYLKILHPIYSSYLSYWIFIYPAIVWPLPLAKAWCKTCRFFAKLFGRL